jgi:hypothetical protein
MWCTQKCENPSANFVLVLPRPKPPAFLFFLLPSQSRFACVLFYFFRGLCVACIWIRPIVFGRPLDTRRRKHRETAKSPAPTLQPPLSSGRPNTSSQKNGTGPGIFLSQNRAVCPIVFETIRQNAKCRMVSNTAPRDFLRGLPFKNSWGARLSNGRPKTSKKQYGFAYATNVNTNENLAPKCPKFSPVFGLGPSYLADHSTPGVPNSRASEAPRRHGAPPPDLVPPLSGGQPNTAKYKALAARINLSPCSLQSGILFCAKNVENTLKLQGALCASPPFLFLRFQKFTLEFWHGL